MIKHKSLFFGYFINVALAILLGMSIVKRDTLGIVMYGFCSLGLTTIHYLIACSMQDFFSAITTFANEVEKLKELGGEAKENDNNDLHRR